MSDPAPHNPARHVKFERERGVYAIDVVHDVAHAVIELPDEGRLQESVLHALRVFTAASVPVFCVKIHRTALTLALPLAVAGPHSAPHPHITEIRIDKSDHTLELWAGAERVRRYAR